MDVVLKLRELRRLRGMSQKEAADAAGIGEKSISSFETGERISSMKVSQLERLLKVYGVTLAEFFSGAVDRKIAPWEVSKEENDLMALNEELRALPRRSRSALLARFHRMIEASTEMPRVAKRAVPPPPQHQLRQEWEMLISRN